jgi:uncharacterized protein (TIGR02246 family)
VKRKYDPDKVFRLNQNIDRRARRSKMTRFTGLVLAVIVAAVLNTPANAQSPRDDIEAALVAFAAAFNKGDHEAVAAHYTEDAAVLPPEAARIDGRLNIQKFWKGAIEAGLADLTLKAVEVEASGDWAFEVGELSFSAPGTGSARSTASGKYIVVWKKEADGTWRLYRDIWNANQ